MAVAVDFHHAFPALDIRNHQIRRFLGYLVNYTTEGWVCQVDLLILGLLFCSNRFSLVRGEIEVDRALDSLL